MLVLAGAGTASAQPARQAPAHLPAMTGEPPEVILLTFGEGPEIFEKYGHAALCLSHTSDSEPLCFNYGVTGFDNSAGIAWSFMRRKQIFWLEPELWSSAMRFYKWEDRDIWMQRIALPPDAALALERKIRSDLEEAHRYYIYDHFLDNCTTRLRDLIDTATGGALRAGSDRPYPLTYRELGYRGLAEMPPLIALADFVVGRTIDDTPTIWQAMFHPAVLRRQVEVALGVSAERIYQRHGEAFPTEGSSFHLQMLAIALVFALPLLLARWRRRGERAAVSWATVWLGLWGLVIWGLVALSLLPALRWNEAALVFVPLDLALPVLSAARRRRYARWRVVGLLLVSCLCALGVLHQPLWIPILSAIVPLGIIASYTAPSSRASAGSDVHTTR